MGRVLSHWAPTVNLFCCAWLKCLCDKWGNRETDQWCVSYQRSQSHSLTTVPARRTWCLLAACSRCPLCESRISCTWKATRIAKA
ncbi:hypothetical protein BJ742DRAFT_813612 [Cladochytrium replicatum]|nr:hypothetical protein BJ742DRAFT_813612 [Cladochytrium replicatum]